MKNKDVEKLLKNEGSQLAPSSFSTLKDRIFRTDKYLATQIKKEGEEFVPNDYPAVKENIEPVTFVEEKKNNKFSTPLKWGLGTVLAAGITVAIVVPVVNMTNRLYLNTEATCDVTLSDGNNNVLDLSCDVDEHGAVKKESLKANNDKTKKILAGVNAKNYKISSDYLDLFTTDILKFAFETNDKTNNTIFDKAGEYTLSLFISGAGAKDSSYINRVKMQLETNLLSKIKNVNKITVNVIADQTVTGNKDNDLLISRKRYLNALINKLFSEGEDIIDGFDPKNYFDQSSLEEVESAIAYLTDIYNHIPLDSSLADFKKDIKELYDIYSTRKDVLQTLKTDCLNLINSLKQNGFSSDSGLKLDELELSSPYWWNDECDISFDNPGFDLYSFFYDDYPNSDESYIKKETKSIDHIFSTDIDPIAYLIETYNYLVEMIENNNDWFSLAFNLIQNRSNIKDSNGNVEGDINYQYTWSKENYWDSNQSYWEHYWNQ